MTVKRIMLFPDPVLSQPGAPVTQFDETLSQLIRDLNDTLNTGPGVGLAAPQIGVSQRVSVIDIRRRKTRPGEKAPENHGAILLINPVLVEGKGKQIPREGCLSVPDLLANVVRFQDVIVKTRCLDGGEAVIHASGFEALALQHEIDHLDGHLFLDRVANIKTDLFRRKTPGS
jgi:peptide deformylase